jgi:hypothetical protein
MLYAVLLENFCMRNVTLFLFFVFVALLSKGQKDTSLVNRLNAVLNFIKLKQLDKVMDYTYPKAFTVIPREQFSELIKGMYDTDDFSSVLDSVKLDTIFTIVKINEARYAIARHTMLMKMKYKEPITKEDADLLVQAMEQPFGEGNVRFVKATNSLHVFMISYMIAVKDELSPKWTFINFDLKNPEFVELILGKEVIAKLKEYN